MARKVFTDESLETFVDETKSYVNSAVSTKANSSHSHSISDVTNLQSSLDGKAASGHSHSAATTSAAGFMSASDKSKLDGIASGANAYTLPTASSSTLGGVKTTSTVTSTSGLTACPIISGVPYYKDTDTTYSLSSFGVTATAAELNALDGITATVTELNYCDGVTSNIQTQLNGKAASSHGNHVPATQTANNATFLRNDNTWQKVTPANIGAAASSHTHDYLPLSGGTLTGALTCNSTLKVSGTSTLGRIDASNEYLTGSLYVGGKTSTSDGKTGVAFGSSGNITMQGSSEPKINFITGTNTSANNYVSANTSNHLTCYGRSQVKLQNVNGGVYLSMNSSNNLFTPTTSGACGLGSSALKWGLIYSTSATVQTSDAREKENIIPLGVSPVMTLSLDDEPTEQIDIHSELFDRLIPVQYNMINGEGRICYGLIAQQVIEAMAELGIEENELDLVRHEYYTEEETGEEKDTYGIAYANMIGLLIHEVQKLKAEVATLKAESGS